VRRDLESELKYKLERSVRNQIIGSLLNRVNFELPEITVAQETRNVVYDIVQQNAKRGVSREIIEKEKNQIYTAATQNAKERVKVNFLLQKIADKEDLKVSQEEIVGRINYLAGAYNIPPEKFAEDLRKRNGVLEIFDQILKEKTMDFLEKNARIEEVPVGTLDPAPKA